MALAELMEEDGGGRSQARRQYRARPTTPAPLAALQRSKVSQDRGGGGQYRARPTTPAPLAALQRSKASQDRGAGADLTTNLQ